MGLGGAATQCSGAAQPRCQGSVKPEQSVSHSLLRQPCSGDLQPRAEPGGAGSSGEGSAGTDREEHSSPSPQLSSGTCGTCLVEHQAGEVKVGDWGTCPMHQLSLLQPRVSFLGASLWH